MSLLKPAQREKVEAYLSTRFKQGVFDPKNADHLHFAVFIAIGDAEKAEAEAKEAVEEAQEELNDLEDKLDKAKKRLDVVADVADRIEELIKQLHDRFARSPSFEDLRLIEGFERLEDWRDAV